jgi:hypothetical protein
MKILEKFDDYIFDKLFEKEGDTLPFVLSDRLRQLLKIIKHPIAEKIIEISNITDISYKSITLIDYDSDDVGKFTYVLSSKLYDYMTKKHNYAEFAEITNDIIYYNVKEKLFDVNRISTSIVKFINKLFPDEFKNNGEPGYDIESFMNLIKSKRSINFDRFKIVKGDDIVKFYNENNYDSRRSGSALGNSCMRYNSCSGYIDFYANNDVELVILLSDKEDDKIVGRAILWNIMSINGEDVNRKFMDRIYTIFDYDVYLFKDFATINKWLYKKNQDMNEYTEIVDTITNESKQLELVTSSGFTESKRYPFMDTMKFLYLNNEYLANRNELDNGYNIYKLESTMGSYENVTVDDEEDEHENEVYIEYYGDWYNLDDVVYCEYGGEYRLEQDAIEILDTNDYATRDYAEDELYFSNEQDGWLIPDNSVRLEYYGDYVTQRYAVRNYFYSERDDEYYKADDCVFSEHYDTYLLTENTVEVFTDIDKDNKDYREEGDSTYIAVYIKDYEYPEYYDEDLKDEFIFIITDLTDDKHGIYSFPDEFAIPCFKWKGKYYSNKFKDELTGQKRIFEKNKNIS